MKSRNKTNPTPLRLVALNALAMAILSGGLSCGAPSAAYAVRKGEGDETGARSELAAITLPKGAARSDSGTLTKGFAGVLAELAERVDLTAGKDPAEVFLWEGANFRPNRAAFMRTQIETALTEAGYAYKAIDSSKVFVNPFREEYGLAPQEGSSGGFQLSPWDKFYYFQATNARKHKTLVGVLVNGENEKRTVLALARVAYVKEESDALPEITGENSLLVKDKNDAMKGEPMPKMPAFSPLALKARTARGVVKDMSGKPIVGAHIVVQASAAGGFRTDVSAKTNAAGLYEIALPIGVCRVVNADCTVTYQDRTYVLPLKAVSGERKYFNAQEGGVENFVLQTYGPADPAAVAQRPEHGSNYYGGVVRLVWFHNDLPEGGTFELTLQPQGKLLGDVPPRTLVFRLPNKGLGEAFLNDIPLGRYTLRAKLYDKGDALPIRLKSLNAEEIGMEVDVIFESGQSELANLEHSGVRRFDVLLKP